MRTLIPLLAILLCASLVLANPLVGRERRNFFDVADFVWESLKDAGDSAGTGVRNWWQRMRDRFQDESDGRSVQDHFRDMGDRAKERLEKWMDALKDWLNQRQAQGANTGGPAGTSFEVIRAGPWSNEDGDQ